MLHYDSADGWIALAKDLVWQFQDLRAVVDDVKAQLAKVTETQDDESDLGQRITVLNDRVQSVEMIKKRTILPL